jgi:hypothetical protein
MRGWLRLPSYAWRKAESSLVMNFTIEFFRTRPSDEAHATLDGFMGQDPAHQTSAPPPKEKNVRKKLDAATGEILQRRAGAKVQQGCKQ